MMGEDEGGMDLIYLLRECYRAAVAAVDPDPVLARVLESEPVGPDSRVHVLALGKAAPAMARAALRTLRRRGVHPAGGLLVTVPELAPPNPGLPVAFGDHPVPDQHSRAAALALETAAHRVRPGDTVWVLLSGGTSSLVGTPVAGLAPDELRQATAILLGSGLDIGRMNLVRRRLSRWGAGRLAAAMPHAAIHVFMVSDVIGDDPATIGSGPCEPDPSTAGEIETFLDHAGLRDRLPLQVSDYLARVRRGEAPETPKPGDPVFRQVETRIIATNAMARDAAGWRARALGATARVVETPVEGEASVAGRRIAQELLEVQRANGPEGKVRCLIWGGEPTVTLGETPGRGGRCQELGLAAARLLALAQGTGSVALLAAGTDGRDGPTNAAGTVVDGTTWDRIARAGIDPDRALREHDAYAALRAADALIPAGYTGTNVMDVMIAGVTGAAADPAGSG